MKFIIIYVQVLILNDEGKIFNNHYLFMKNFCFQLKKTQIRVYIKDFYHFCL